ncbi:MAG: LysM peptidoglycan-binding domain-containing protein [Rhodospirillales bacterium]|nr:LysM peptidoglycan-binding domain-containing protein [Rhodospirillales bacterium]
MSENQPRSGVVRPLLLACAGVAVLGGAVYYAMHGAGGGAAPAGQNQAAAPPAAPAPVAASAKPAKPATPAAPRFDIVRINKAGDAVMAGRAAPGAKVTIASGGKEVGSATADANGQWVFVPSTPLGPGGHELTLAEQMPGGAQLAGKGSVLLVVPPSAGSESGTETANADAAAPLAVLTSPGGPQVMQGGAAPGAGGLGIGAVDYGASGQMQIEGAAPPGSRLRLFLDNRPLGEAEADGQGRWHLNPAIAAPPGDHRLRVERLGKDGAVLAEAARDFPRALPGEAAPAGGRIIVRQGQNLWMIARRTYGAGIRYTIIFRANRGQIRDPNLIYPGQSFALPEATPPSSSKSR